MRWRARAAGEEAEDEDAYGFYFKTLKTRRPELNETLVTFKEMLAASQGSQDSSKLKVWALQDLGVQAPRIVERHALRALTPLPPPRPLSSRLVRG